MDEYIMQQDPEKQEDLRLIHQILREALTEAERYIQTRNELLHVLTPASWHCLLKSILNLAKKRRFVVK